MTTFQEQESDEVRAAAARSLGQQGSMQAMKPLIACFHDPEPEVRLWAGLA